MKRKKLDNFYKVGLTIVIILLVATIKILSDYAVKPVSTTTTTTSTTTQPTTTVPTITTTSTTTSTPTTTLPTATLGTDLQSLTFSSSKRIINAGNFVDLRLYLRNSKKYVELTEIRIYGIDIQDGSADEDTWGVPGGSYIITPDKTLLPSETAEYGWTVQAPTSVVNETKFFLKARIYYMGDSIKYYVDAPEYRITVNP